MEDRIGMKTEKRSNWMPNVDKGAPQRTAHTVAPNQLFTDELYASQTSGITSYIAGREMKSLLAKVTAAPARMRPLIDTPLSTAVDAYARIVPTKVLEYPSVALDPTFQKMFFASAPFNSTNFVFGDTRRELAVWNTHTALLSPLPSSVTLPPVIVMWPPLVQWTPGLRVRPESSFTMLLGGQTAAAAALYAVIRSAAHLLELPVLISTDPSSN